MTGDLTVLPGVDRSRPLEEQLPTMMGRLGEYFRDDQSLKHEQLRGEIGVVEKASAQRDSQLAEALRKLATEGRRTAWASTASIMLGTVLLGVAGAYPWHVTVGSG